MVSVPPSPPFREVTTPLAAVILVNNVQVRDWFKGRAYHLSSSTLGLISIKISTLFLPQIAFLTNTVTSPPFSTTHQWVAEFTVHGFKLNISLLRHISIWSRRLTRCFLWVWQTWVKISGDSGSNKCATESSTVRSCNIHGSDIPRSRMYIMYCSFYCVYIRIIVGL